MSKSVKRSSIARSFRALCGGVLGLGMVLVAQPISAQSPRAADRGPVTVSEQAKQIHSRGFVFDGHNDLPWEVRTNASRSFDKLDISKPQPKQHTDIARLKQGGVGAQFWSVYVPVDTAKNGVAHQTTLEQIEIVKAMVERYPDTFALALTTDDIKKQRAEGKIASLIGVEGGHSIENSIEKLRRLFSLGARYMTLTHSESLDWADSCTGDVKVNGLSEFGKEVVREMNRMGMLVDISHVSPATMQAALDASAAPVMFSHSSARGIADHPRNVPDEILKQLPADGGVVMVNFYSAFVVPEAAARFKVLQPLLKELKEKHKDDLEAYKAAAKRLEAQYPIQQGSVHDVADHIDHIVKVAGVDHVGIGSDYDGITMCPKGLEDVSTYPVLTQVLLDRGYSEEAIHKMMSGNIIRVMEQAEKVAKQLQSQK